MEQKEVVNAFEPDLTKKYGCAWFMWDSKDPVRNPERTGGWASIGGDEPFYFKNPKELSKDIVWWTNLSKPEAWSLGSWSHIKHASFLGPNWLSLMSEWGLPNELDELKKYCTIWAELFARLSSIFIRWNNASIDLDNLEENNVYNNEWKLGDGDLHDVLSSKLNFIIDKSESNPILEKAFFDIIENELPANALNNKRKITLTLPRVEHARKILNNRYPVGEFEEVKAKDWPIEEEERWDWVQEQHLPILLRFDQVIFRTGYEKEAQLWWGLRGKRFINSMMEPVWLTSEEALEMMVHTEAYPSVAMKGKGWVRFSDVKNWPEIPRNFLYDNSIISGLLAESLWRAASTPARTPTKRIKSGVTPRAIWWRSVDRRSCYKVAKEFQSKGFTVTSYGEGMVTVLFDPQTTLISDWIDVFNKTGVKIPKMLANEMPLNEFANFKDESSISSKSIDIWLKSTQDIYIWCLLDRLLWPSVELPKDMLKSELELSLRTVASIQAPEEIKEISKDKVKEWSNLWKNQLMENSRSAVRRSLNK